MKQRYLWFKLIVLFILVSCADGNSGVSDKKLESDIAYVSAKIDELSADLSCDTGTQCLTIVYGHKPCGGPAGFRIYSSRNTDESLINEYADDYFELTMEYNERNDLISDCSIETPPALHCDIECKLL